MDVKTNTATRWEQAAQQALASLPEDHRTWTWKADAPEEHARLLGEGLYYQHESLDGPWQGEPDKVQWVDPATNLDCLLVRNRFGSWCGYVGVLPGHPLYQKSAAYSDNEDREVGQLNVHGGVTFADHCTLGEPVMGICHVPYAGREDKVWWIGYDCGHAFDLAPGRYARDVLDPTWPSHLGGWNARNLYDHDAALSEQNNRHVEKYRDLAYVIEENRALAIQLFALSK